ncbi:HAD family hydrolase [Xylophilus sp. GOD-11R]|uniref:HAD family hydrolase n=1 Tax=Xylophilus sp. GOD-11R TaxID=3089814 RepID=UPI00298C26B7|nr:HAD family hydrolase [Xylophilus sp. GOD-11R]WPB59207.1 HAD family hydrolase [Xylophilus sp. GOD-11R]
MPIRAVLFAMDGTLFDHLATVRSLAAEQVVNLKGLVPAELRQPYLDRMIALESLGHLDRLTVYRQLVREFGLDAGHRRLHPRRLANEFERRYLAHAQARPDALPTLRALKSHGLRLGIVCNARVSTLVAKIDAIGLRPWLDDMLASEEAGVRKPDPAIFRQALVRLGVRPGEALHVGGHPQMDVEAARAAGLQVAWLRREGASAPEAVAVIDELSGVVGAVRAGAGLESLVAYLAAAADDAVCVEQSVNSGSAGDGHAGISVSAVVQKGLGRSK